MIPRSNTEQLVDSSNARGYQPYRSIEEFGPGQNNGNATVMSIMPPNTEFTENQEERCPILLCLDRSGSMHGNPIRELREAIQQFKNDLLEDPAVAAKVDVGIITFNNLVQFHDFTNSTSFELPELQAQGGTLISLAMQISLDMCEKRKDTYRQNGIAYHRPWIILITDGLPDHDDEESIRAVKERLREAEENRRAAIFTVACSKNDHDNLAQWLTDNIAPPSRPAKRTSEANFKELFRWLSNSQIALSKSSPGDRVELPTTDGWEIV